MHNYNGHFSWILPALCRTSRARTHHWSQFRRLATAAVLPNDGLSIVQGSQETPLLEETLGQYWNIIVNQHGDRPALVSMHELSSTGNTEFSCLRWSFSEMDEHVNQLARGMLQLGIQKGDRVAVLCPNNSSYAALQWATAKIGAILATMNPAYKITEIVAALQTVGARALFMVPQLKSVDAISGLCKVLPSISTSRPNELQEEILPDLKSVVLIDNLTGRNDAFRFHDVMNKLKGAFSYRDVLGFSGGSRNEVTLAGENFSNQDIVNLQFTSGTTGTPKAVALTHRNILNNGYHIGSNMRLTPQDKLCNVPPLFHCFGLVLGNLAAWTQGSCIVYPSEFFDAKATIRTVVEEKCTALHGVATMFIAELALIDQIDKGEKIAGLEDIQLDFSSLRTGIGAGSPVPDEVMRKIMSRMNLKEQTIAYGMSETSPVTFQSATEDPFEKRIHTVGRVLPHVTAKIVNPSSINDQNPKPLPIGETGELIVAGYPLQTGYWRNEVETEKVMKVDSQGIRWMWTGDLGKMDNEGYLSIVGRSKDVIIRGGENLFPVTIENRILTLDGIADASVVAVPDPFFGEVVGAFIKRKSGPSGLNITPDMIRRHVLDTMSHQNNTSWIWFLGQDGVDENFPLTASGKIRKVELREWAQELSSQGIGRTVPKRPST